MHLLIRYFSKVPLPALPAVTTTIMPIVHGPGKLMFSACAQQSHKLALDPPIRPLTHPSYPTDMKFETLYHSLYVLTCITFLSLKLLSLPPHAFINQHN